MVLISNGPGEVATWVMPLAEKLHSKIFIKPRASDSKISLRLVLVPCPNATGKEKNAAERWGQFEQITQAKDFWKLILNPSKYGDWPEKGLVVFLGGDQFWSVLLAARLGYKNITYAEWIARWPYWNDRIAAMSPKVRNQLPKKFRNRCKVVGDLMADLPELAKGQAALPQGKWVALMPGSKKAKLRVGMPFFLEVADRLAKVLPECNFLLPLAPTTSIAEIESFSSSSNSIAKEYESSISTIKPSSLGNLYSKLITNAGTEILLHKEHPAHIQLSQCDLALTTVGANTAELGALGVPMIVIVPTQHLSVMQAWDGFIGLLARLPGLNWCIGLLISHWKLKKRGFLAWPNISAGRMIVPEKIGNLFPKDIAKEAYAWLSSPERLSGQRDDLRTLRGQPGANDSLCIEIIGLLPDSLVNYKQTDSL